MSTVEEHLAELSDPNTTMDWPQRLALIALVRKQREALEKAREVAQNERGANARVAVMRITDAALTYNPFSE